LSASPRSNPSKASTPARSGAQAARLVFYALALLAEHYHSTSTSQDLCSHGRRLARKNRLRHRLPCGTMNSKRSRLCSEDPLRASSARSIRLPSRAFTTFGNGSDSLFSPSIRPRAEEKRRGDLRPCPGAWKGVWDGARKIRPAFPVWASSRTRGPLARNSGIPANQKRCNLRPVLDGEALALMARGFA